MLHEEIRISRPNRVIRFKVILLCSIGALTIRIGFLLKGSLRMIRGIMGGFIMGALILSASLGNLAVNAML